MKRLVLLGLTLALALPNVLRAEDIQKAARKQAKAQAQAQHHAAKQNAAIARVANQGRAGRTFNAAGQAQVQAQQNVNAARVNRHVAPQVTTQQVPQTNTGVVENANRNATWRNRGDNDGRNWRNNDGNNNWRGNDANNNWRNNDGNNVQN